MKTIYLILASSLFFTGLYAQDFNYYVPLSSKGELPTDFTQRISERVEADIAQEVSREDKGRARKSKKEFLLESNYALEDLLFSGHILYGDQVTDYINKVADKVLAKRPELRTELRFYCLNSSSVNAFATNQGMIFITLGLISELQNEAQLAYVISHEAVHYINKHVISSRVEMDAIIHGSKVEYDSEEELITNLSGYSKALEMEADSVGFEIFRESGYDLEESNSMFNVLQFQRLPFDEIKYDYSVITEEDVLLPELYILPQDSLKAIDFSEDYDDSQSSHPNVATRRAAVGRFINKTETKEGKHFLVSEDEFFTVRNICRFECIKNALKELEYVEALYNIQVLQKEFPESYFLKKSTAKALYGIAKYKNAGHYRRSVEDYDDYEGQIGGLYYFFESATALQSNLLALNYCWKLKSGHSEDEYLKLICADLFRDFHKNHKFSLEEIEGKLAYIVNLNQPNTIVPEEKVAIVIEETEIRPIVTIEKETDLGKYEKLALMKSKAVKEDKNTDADLTVNADDQFFIYNLHQRMKEESFLKDFSESLLSFKNEEKEDEKQREYLKSLTYKKRTRYLNKEKKLNSHISADKVVFVDPQFYYVNQKGLRLVNSEKRQFNFYKQIDLSANAADLKQVTLSPKASVGFTGEMLSDMGKFKQWMYEKSIHSDLPESTHFICAENEHIKYLSDKYNTDYFAFSAIVRSKEKRRGKLLYLAAGIYIPPLMPLMLVKVFSPKYSSYYYTAVFNVQSGDVEFDKSYTFDYRVNKGHLNSAIYDNMIQMKDKKL